jgi:ribosome-binding factor A
LADSVRIRRVAEQIRGEISEILRDEVLDPRIGLVTITRVKLASDMGAATIFYSPLGEDPDEARRVELKRVMGSVQGFIRRSLSKRVKLRHTPALRFVLDDSIAEGSHTLDLLRELDTETGSAKTKGTTTGDASGTGHDGEEDQSDGET